MRLFYRGGFGAAKNLSTFAFDGENCTINKEVEAAIAAMIEAKKPIGALCIAPVILGKINSGYKRLRSDKREGAANAIELYGGKAYKIKPWGSCY